MRPIHNDRIEKYLELIEFVGEEKIERLYLIMGSTKFSFAMVRNFLKKRKILNSIHDGNSCKKTARQCGVSKMTVYRYLNNELKKVTH